MQKTGRVIGAIGFLLVMLGAGAMDSTCLIAPVTMLLCGVVMMYSGASMEGVL